MDWGERFRHRADHEARRYGADPWVWVRELIQNARDAGATHVALSTALAAEVESVSCRDDGAGMSFAEARRLLFTLYASGKTGGADLAGRFGVGFWAVLRFAPTRIVVRSRPAGAARGWEIALDRELAHGDALAVDMAPGTEVVLSRPASGEELSARLCAEVAAEAPFVTRRGRPRRALPVTVDGVLATRPFALSPPCLELRRGATRGVVALADEGRVEIYAHGLLVRRAASLDDLVAPASGRRRRALPPGLAPCVLLDSPRFEALLSRGDVRHTEHLRRAVELARRELDRLLRHAVDRVRPPTVGERLRELVGAGHARVVVAAALVAIAVAAAVLGSLPPPPAELARQHSVAAPPRPYRDLLADYRGPTVDPAPALQGGLDLRYRPPERPLHLAVRHLVGADGERWLDAPAAPASAEAGAGDAEAIELELGLDAAAGELPLPLPVGTRVDPASVRLDQRPLALSSNGGGAARLRLAHPSRGRLSYRVIPDPTPAQPSAVPWPPLPAPVRLGAGPGATPEAVAELALARLAAVVRYDRSPAAFAVLGGELAPGELFPRAVALGAGDCDVLAALLAAMLEEAGVEARLAIGWVGRAGSVLPGLHAWTEHVDGSGRWRVVDPTLAVAGPAPAAPATPSPRWWRWAAAVGLGATAAAAAAAVARRSRRRFHPGDGLSVLELVRALLADPGGPLGVTGLWRRRLVATAAGERVALAEVARRAGRGRLLRGRRGNPLTDTATAAGELVLAADDALARLVAEHFAATDLETRAALLAAGRRHPLTDAAEAALARLPGGWRVRLADAAGDEVTVVAAGATRVAVVAASSPLWRAARTAAPAAAGLLLLVEAVAWAVAGDDDDATAVVAELARQALAAAAEDA